jgi:hypothetical protein
MSGTRGRGLPVERLVAHLRTLLATARPGDQLPSQAALSEEWGYTQVTVGRAYQRLILTGEVIVRRHQGYYKPTPPTLVWGRNDPDGWPDDAARSGHAHRVQDALSDYATAATMVGPFRLADLLDVPEDAALSVEQRTRYVGPADGKPDIPDSITHVYRPHTLDEPEQVASHQEIVIPRLASEHEADTLSLLLPTAVVEIIRIGRTGDGAAVQVEHSITGSQLRYELPAAAAPQAVEPEPPCA